MSACLLRSYCSVVVYLCLFTGVVSTLVNLSDVFFFVCLSLNIKICMYDGGINAKKSKKIFDTLQGRNSVSIALLFTTGGL